MMELDFNREILTEYDTVAAVTLCQEETLESIVPDACPDILRIVDVYGQSDLLAKQSEEGSAAVSGIVRASILYQPEGGGGLRKMDVSLPFQCRTEAPGLTTQGRVLACTHLCNAEARVLNPRKVLLRVDLAVEVTAYQPIERPLCQQALQPSEDICQLRRQCEHYALISVEEKPFTFIEQIRLQSNSSSQSILLAKRGRAVCTESKLIGGKLIFKGVVELTVLLQEADGRLSTEHESLPFSQVMEIPQTGEDLDCRVCTEITDLQCDLVPGDGRSAEVELELLAQLRVFSRRSLTVLQDIYSTKMLMETQLRPQQLCRSKDSCLRPQGVREFLETPGLVRSVLDSRVTLGQLKGEQEGGAALFAVDAYVTILYLDEQEQPQRVHRTIPVVCRLPEEYDPGLSCVSLSAGELFAAPAAGGVEVRFNADFLCQSSCRYTVPMVWQAKTTGERGCGEKRRPSVVLRLPQSGEMLWDIAKSHGTTTAEIIQANELEDESLPECRMLLIPGSR